MPFISLKKFILLVGFASFVLVGFLGLSHLGMGATSMNMDGQMRMEVCPLSLSADCSMTPLVHFSDWQDLFQNMPIMTLFVLLSFFAVSLLFYFDVLSIGLLLEPFISESFFLNRTCLLPDQYSFAYSQGILNPKAY